MILSPPERRPGCSGLGWPRPSASSHGRALSLLVVAFFPFPEGGGEDEEEEEEQREGCCTWAGEECRTEMYLGCRTDKSLWPGRQKQASNLQGQVRV